ncbi:recombination regulator RecX [Alkalicoccus chagannorensis]|uniref:recombination regulator RecX n=1 Tax=Alkalicoccus chagannorensis TaxID=427072 RepID=UPI00041E8F0E|nr:recombination regulator RecX [Alkalicoccus chagannorensis]
MPEITKIKAAVKTKHRYHIYTKQGEKEVYTFSVSEDVLIQEALAKGKELTAEEIERLKETDEMDKAYQRALNFLSFRMRSEKELREYLRGQEVPEEEQEWMVEKLYELDFLDDERFAASFVRTRRDQSKKGPGVIRQELKQKGIDGETAEKALEQYSEEEEIDLALALVEKKQKSYQKDAAKIRKQKLMQFLMQRGFSSSAASAAMEAADLESSDEAELEAAQAHAEKLERRHSSKDERTRKQKVKQGMYQKGFAKETIEKVLENLEENE